MAASTKVTCGSLWDVLGTQGRDSRKLTSKPSRGTNHFPHLGLSFLSGNMKEQSWVSIE